MEQVEQARGGFDRVAACAQRDVAFDLAEADQKFVVATIDRVEAQRLRRRVMAGELAGGFDLAAVDFDRLRHLDRAAAEQAERSVGRGDDGRFDPALGWAGVDDQRDAPVERGEDMATPASG